MGLFSIRAEKPERVAQVVSYAPDMDRLPLKGPFIRQASVSNLGMLAVYEQITGKPKGVPQYSEVFQLDRTIRTPHGSIFAKERGLVVEDPTQPNKFSVAIPTRESYWGDTTLQLTEVTVPDNAAANRYLTSKSLAVGQAIVELAQGNIDNPEGKQ